MISEKMMWMFAIALVVIALIIAVVIFLNRQVNLRVKRKDTEVEVNTSPQAQAAAASSSSTDNSTFSGAELEAGKVSGGAVVINEGAGRPARTKVQDIDGSKVINTAGTTDHTH